MAQGFSSSDADDWVRAERDVAAAIGDELVLDFDSMAAVSNVFRVATAMRNHVEREILDRDDLSFTAFTVLWVLWIWGEQEARHVAQESGVSRATLTGVVTTLERRGLAQRRANPDDRRSVLVSITDEGRALTRRLFVEFHDAEQRVSKDLDPGDKRAVAHALRGMLRRLEAAD